MPSYSIVDTGNSRSFPEDHPFLAGAAGSDPGAGEVTVYLGAGAAGASSRAARLGFFGGGGYQGMAGTRAGGPGGRS